MNQELRGLETQLPVELLADGFPVPGFGFDFVWLDHFARHFAALRCNDALRGFMFLAQWRRTPSTTRGNSAWTGGVEVLEQLRGQSDLTGQLVPQPGVAAQFDDQSVDGHGSGEFDLHDRRCSFELGALGSPATERGVVESILAGEGGGGEAVAIKGVQQLRVRSVTVVRWVR